MSDAMQFKECTKQLQGAIKGGREISGFTNVQLSQIEKGRTPENYTWHHDVEPGKMQLVDTYAHIRAAHTGGRSIWGGGSDNR